MDQEFGMPSRYERTASPYIRNIRQIRLKKGMIETFLRVFFKKKQKRIKKSVLFFDYSKNSPNEDANSTRVFLLILRVNA